MVGVLVVGGPWWPVEVCECVVWTRVDVWDMAGTGAGQPARPRRGGGWRGQLGLASMEPQANAAKSVWAVSDVLPQCPCLPPYPRRLAAQPGRAPPAAVLAWLCASTTTCERRKAHHMASTCTPGVSDSLAAVPHPRTTHSWVFPCEHGSGAVHGRSQPRTDL